ncbi:MAG: signal recognition particle protein, partial [Flammeovirgaceae bacterium]
QTFDEEEARRLNAKMRKNQFDLNDFLNQLQQIKKMGNMKDMLSMIPGMGKAMKDVDIDDNAFKPVEAIIRSMTMDERENPDKLNASRKARVAKGSGTSIQQVNQLLKQFDDMKKMMETMNKMGGGKRALGAINPFAR